MLPPAVAVAEALFDTLTSVTPMTVVLALDVLLLLFVSALSPLATAVLVSTVASGTEVGTKTVRVNVAFAPLASEASVQAAVFVPVCPQLAAGPVFCTMETNDVCDGKKSSMRGLSEVSGPL